jgi:hypothetical protein
VAVIVDQQVDGLVLGIEGEALLDGVDEARGALLAEALDEGAGVGADGGDGLPVERAGRRPPEHGHQEARRDREDRDEEQGEAEGGRLEKAGRSRPDTR